MVAKIGTKLGEGHAGLSKGQRALGDATLLELFLALREELNDLYTKLNGDTGVADTNYLTKKFEE